MLLFQFVSHLVNDDATDIACRPDGKIRYELLAKKSYKHVTRKTRFTKQYDVLSLFTAFAKNEKTHLR